MTWVEKGLEKDKAGGLNGSKGDKNGIISRVHCVWFLALTFPQCSVSWPLLHVVSRACSAAPSPELVWLPSWLPQLLHIFQWINSHPLPVSQSRDREHFKHRGQCYGSESGVWCDPGHMQGTTLGLMGQGARRSLPSSQTASWPILSEPLEMENGMEMKDGHQQQSWVDNVDMFALQFWDWQTCKHSNIKFWMASSGRWTVDWWWQGASLYCRNHSQLHFPPAAFFQNSSVLLLPPIEFMSKFNLENVKLSGSVMYFIAARQQRRIGSWEKQTIPDSKFIVPLNPGIQMSSRRQQAGQMSLCLWIDVIAILILHRRLSGKATSTFRSE